MRRVSCPEKVAEVAEAAGATAAAGGVQLQVSALTGARFVTYHARSFIYFVNYGVFSVTASSSVDVG
jgi:hypothetical protein